MKLAFQIAKRFLLSAKRQTIVIILGIAIGVSVQVFIGSLISGLQASLINSTIGSTSQLTVTSDQPISGYDSLMTTIKDASSNINEITPTITISGSLVKGSTSENIVFRGFDFATATGIYPFDQWLTEGALPTTSDHVALGAGLKTLLGVGVGDSITYDSPVYGQTTLVISGFFDTKVQSLNNAWVITPLATIQTILNEGDVVTSIETQLTDVFADITTKDAVVAAIGSGYTVTTWTEQNQQLLSGLNGQSISSLMIQIFVIVSVVLGISSVLAISVLQKSRQLGILKAMGIQDKDASKIFLFEGFILGIFGAILGILFGLGLSYMFTKFAVNPDGTPVVALQINGGFIALSGGIALVASTLAALSPAIKSSKLSVIEVIRNG